MNAPKNLRPNFLVPAEHSGGLLRTPEHAMLAWGVYTDIPHPMDLLPQAKPLVALLAAHDAHARRIEELCLLVEMLIDAGGADLQAKLIAFGLNEADKMRKKLQLEALLKIRDINANRTQYEAAVEEEEAQEGKD